MKDYEKTGNGEAPWIDLPFKASLRDYFAGQIIQGLTISEYTDRLNILASDSYKIADAMLKERNK